MIYLEFRNIIDKFGNVKICYNSIGDFDDYVECGKCYQALENKSHAEKDFAKAKALGYRSRKKMR